MEITYKEAYGACVRHYVERGCPEEWVRKNLLRDEAEIFRIYDEVQKEEELAKHIRWEKIVGPGGLTLMKGYRIDEEPPPASEE